MNQTSPSFRRNVINSSVLNLLPRAGAFLLTLVIGAKFGASESSDLYFYVFSTVGVVAVFMRGINGAVLLPEYAHLVESEGETVAMRFMNLYLWIVVGIGVLVTAVLLAAPIWSWQRISSFPIEALQKNRAALLLAALGLVPTIALYFLSDVMIARKHFGLPSVAGAIPYALSLLVLSGLKSLVGVWPAVLLACWAAGCTAGVIMLLVVLRKSADWRLFQVGFRRHLVVEKNIFFAQSGNIFSVLAVQVPAYYLTGLGTGAVSVISYARTLATIPKAFFSDHVSLVAGISFNELYARKNFAELNRIFCKCALMIFLGLSPVVFFAFMFHAEIVSAIPMWSQKMGPDGAVVVQATVIMMLALPWQGVDSLSARLFMAGRAIGTALVGQVLYNIVLVGLTIALLKKMGPVGYASALPITMSIYMLLIMPVMLRASFPWLQFGRLMARCIGGAAICAVVLVGMHAAFPTRANLLPVIGSVYLLLLGLIFLAGGGGSEARNYTRSYAFEAWSRLLLRFTRR